MIIYGYVREMESLRDKLIWYEEMPLREIAWSLLKK
jgi:hypothetical protein